MSTAWGNHGSIAGGRGSTASTFVTNSSGNVVPPPQLAPSPFSLPTSTSAIAITLSSAPAISESLRYKFRKGLDAIPKIRDYVHAVGRIAERGSAILIALPGEMNTVHNGDPQHTAVLITTSFVLATPEEAFNERVVFLEAPVAGAQAKHPDIAPMTLLLRPDQLFYSSFTGTGTQKAQGASGHNNQQNDDDDDEDVEELAFSVVACTIDSEEDQMRRQRGGGGSVLSGSGSRFHRGSGSNSSSQGGGLGGSWSPNPSRMNRDSSDVGVSGVSGGLRTILPIPLPILPSQIPTIKEGDTHLIVTHLDGQSSVVNATPTIVVGVVEYVDVHHCVYRHPRSEALFSSGGAVFSCETGDFLGIQHQCGDNSFCLLIRDVVIHLFEGGMLGSCRQPIWPDEEDAPNNISEAENGSTNTLVPLGAGSSLYNRYEEQERSLKPPWWTRAKLRDVGVGNQLVDFDEFERFRQREIQGLAQPETLKPRTAKEVWAEWFTDYRSLILIMHAFPYCSKIATLALRELASHEQRLNLSSVALLGGIGVILQVLDNHPFDVTLIETGVTCLARLSTFDNNRDAIARCDGAAVVASIMYEFPYSHTIQQWATYVLLSLTCTQCRGHNIVESLLSSQALHKVIHNMRVFPGATDLQKWSSQLISAAMDEVELIVKDVSSSTASSSRRSSRRSSSKNSGGLITEALAIQQSLWSVLLSSLCISESRGPRADNIDGLTLSPSGGGQSDSRIGRSRSGADHDDDDDDANTSVLTLHLIPLLYQLILHHLNNGSVLTTYMQLLMRLTGGKGAPQSLVRRATAEYTTRTRVSLLATIEKLGIPPNTSSNNNNHNGSTTKLASSCTTAKYIDVFGEVKTMVSPCQFLCDAPVLLGLQRLPTPVLLAMDEVSVADLSPFERRMRTLVLPLGDHQPKSGGVSPTPLQSASSSGFGHVNVAAAAAAFAGSSSTNDSPLQGGGGGMTSPPSGISPIHHHEVPPTTNKPAVTSSATPAKFHPFSSSPDKLHRRSMDDTIGGDDDGEDIIGGAGGSNNGSLTANTRSHHSSSSLGSKIIVGSGSGGGREDSEDPGIVIEVPMDPLGETTISATTANIAVDSGEHHTMRSTTGSPAADHAHPPPPLSGPKPVRTNPDDVDGAEAEEEEERTTPPFSSFFGGSSPGGGGGASRLTPNQYTSDLHGLGAVTSPNGNVVEFFTNLLMKYGLQRLRPVQRKMLIQHLCDQRAKPEDAPEIISHQTTAAGDDHHNSRPPGERRPFVPEGLFSGSSSILRGIGGTAPTTTTASNTAIHNHNNHTHEYASSSHHTTTTAHVQPSPIRPTHHHINNTTTNPSSSSTPNQHHHSHHSGMISSQYARGARSVVLGGTDPSPTTTTATTTTNNNNNNTTRSAGVVHMGGSGSASSLRDIGEDMLGGSGGGIVPMLVESSTPATAVPALAAAPAAARKLSIFTQYTSQQVGGMGGGGGAATPQPHGRARGASIIHFPTGGSRSNLLNSGPSGDGLGGFNAGSSALHSGNGGMGGSTMNSSTNPNNTSTRQMLRDFMAERDALSAGEDDDVLATRGMSLCGPEQFAKSGGVGAGASVTNRRSTTHHVPSNSNTNDTPLHSSATGTTNNTPNSAIGPPTLPRRRRV